MYYRAPEAATTSAGRRAIHGSGHPLLLFAPGGLRSQLDYWRQSPANPGAPPPWMNPMVDLASRFTVIGMDQRNAGRSRGAVTETHAVSGFAKTMMERDPSLREDVLRKFGHNMFGGDFVFSVSRDFVRRCPTPLLLIDPPGHRVPDTPHAGIVSVAG